MESTSISVFLHQPYTSFSISCAYHSVNSPLSSSITPSLFHFLLNTYRFHKSFHRRFTSSTDYYPDHFFWGTRFCFLVFLYFCSFGTATQKPNRMEIGRPYTLPTIVAFHLSFSAHSTFRLTMWHPASSFHNPRRVIFRTKACSGKASSRWADTSDWPKW